MDDALEIETKVTGHRVPKALGWAGLGGAIAVTLGVEWLARRGYIGVHPLIVRFAGIGAVVAGALFARRAETCRVRVTREAIEIGGRRWGRAEIESVSRARVQGTATLTLLGPNVSLEVDDATATAVIEKLELDAGHRVAKYTVPGRIAIATPLLWNAAGYRLVVLIWLVPILALWKKLHYFPPELAYALITVGAVFMAALIAPSTLQVGSDGFVVRWLGTRRYIAFSDVVSVDEQKKLGMAALRFTLRDGRSFTVVSGNDPKSDAALSRLREAMKVEAASTDAPTAQALVLERGTRTAREWLDYLRAVGAGATATLRSADVDLDVLWSVLDDPRAGTAKRIAAAVALAERGGEGTPERLRVATEASASPRLRVAVEATVSHDEAALLAALEEELAEEERREKRA